MTASSHLGPRPKSRAIVVCVDDYGLHDGVNQAALDLVRRGRVSAVSCLVDGPAWHSGAEALRTLATEAEVGLHLNFTEDFGQGGCHALPRLIACAFARLLDRAQLRASIQRQLDRFGQAMGRLPDFVDGHQHVHQLPVIREALIEVMNQHCGATRPWLRATHPNSACMKSGLPRAAVFKSALIGWLGARPLRALAVRHGYPQNNCLVGVYGFELSEADYLGKMRAWLTCAEDGDVLMCHPSVPWNGADPIQGARNQEYRVLSSEAFSGLREAAGIAIGPLRQRRGD